MQTAIWPQFMRLKGWRSTNSYSASWQIKWYYERSSFKLGSSFWSFKLAMEYKLVGKSSYVESHDLSILELNWLRFPDIIDQAVLKIAECICCWKSYFTIGGNIPSIWPCVSVFLFASSHNNILNVQITRNCQLVPLCSTYGLAWSRLGCPQGITYLLL